MHTIRSDSISNGERVIFRPFSSLAWVTDLGYVPTLVRERIRQARMVLEANHCSKMLEDDKKRPWSLKQRIREGIGICPINLLSICLIQWKEVVGKKFSMHLQRLQ